MTLCPAVWFCETKTPDKKHERLLNVTGKDGAKAGITVTNQRALVASLPEISDVTKPPSYEVQAWPINVHDQKGNSIAMLKYVKKTTGESQWVFADIDYSKGSPNWAQLTIGHKADGTGYLETGLPFDAKGGLNVSKGSVNINSSANISGNIYLGGALYSDSVIRGGRLETSGTTGNVIRTNMKGLTKGQNPSTQQVAYWGIYDEHGVGGAANQVGAISCAYHTDGGTSLRFSSYKSDPSAQTANTLTVGWSASGSKYTSVSGDLTASGDITSEGSLKVLSPTVGHIIRQARSLTKGTNPSSNVYIGHFIYGAGSTSSTSNRLAGNEYSIGSTGNATYTLYCYDFRSGQSGASSLRLGYNADHQPYCNIAASGGINLTGQLNVNDGLHVAEGIEVNSGDVVCGANSMFVGKGTVNFAHQDSVIVTGQNPTNEQQRWPLAVYDKNNAALAYCKFTMRTTGTKEWAFCVAHPKSNGSGNNLGGLVVTCDANGKYGTIGVTADASSNSTDLATTFWVRRYIWTAEESQLVHTVNDETIGGSKTFTNAIRGDTTTLIQTTPWEGISIADTSRTATQNKMLAVALDKDAKRFAGIEVSATTTGQRYVHISMRRRDDSGWVSPFKAVELTDGTTYCEGAHHPPANDDSYKFATTGWANDSFLPLTGGTVTGTLKAKTFQATSDSRLKEDQQIVHYDLSSIKPKRYRFKNDKIHHVGLIAQEVEKVIPEAVSTNEDGYKSLDYNAIIAALVGEVNELKEEIKKLKNK